MCTADCNATSKLGVRIYLRARGAFLFLRTHCDCLLAHH